MGISDFVKTNPSRRHTVRCFLCTSVPPKELAEVDAALRGEVVDDFGAPITARAICEWLRGTEAGGPGIAGVTTAKIVYHKDRGHHVAS